MFLLPEEWRNFSNLGPLQVSCFTMCSLVSPFEYMLRMTPQIGFFFFNFLRFLLGKGLKAWILARIFFLKEAVWTSSARLDWIFPYRSSVEPDLNPQSLTIFLSTT
jgi:hypothetical protein